MSRNDPLLLQDILDAVAAIERHRPASRALLDEDELVRVFVQKQLEIIGEAAARLTDAMRNSSPGVPWRSIIGMRNRLVHDYANVDCDTMWAVLEQHLDPLRVEVEKLVHDLTG